MFNRKIIKSSIVIGAALFAMFFGAGNMIFPPYLGMESGTEWISGFAGYYVADIGLAILAIIAQTNRGTFEALVSPLGKWAGRILMLCVVLCLGPLISIPRTCATTYELAILPTLKGTNIILFSVIFFAVTLILSLNESKVVDIVGKVLTPVLIFGLLFIIVKGVADPISLLIDSKKVVSPVSAGIKAGYQSMDVLGAVVFGVLIIDSASREANGNKKDVKKIAIGASITAGAGLFIIYLGLTYLGATVSSLFGTHISRSELLIEIVSSLLPGSVGMTFFGVIAGLACLTTSVALTGSAAKYISDIVPGKIKYKGWVTIICAFSAAVSVVGVEKLVAIASPILTIVYPPVLALVILSIFNPLFKPTVCKATLLCATLFAIAEMFSDFGMRLKLLDYLPFSDIGMGWILPTFAVSAITFFATEKFFSKTLDK